MNPPTTADNVLNKTKGQRGMINFSYKWKNGDLIDR